MIVGFKVLAATSAHDALTRFGLGVLGFRNRFNPFNRFNRFNYWVAAFRSRSFGFATGFSSTAAGFCSTAFPRCRSINSLH
jgi:hypothetical protein